MRYAFVEAITGLAKQNPDIMLLTADLGFTVFEHFAQEFPGQFINAGVAEDNMIGVATGLALSGKIPFVYSITPFVTARPYEFIRNDIAVHLANVKIVGSGAGLSYSEAGPTHHAQEDIALMRGLPRMKVLCPADPIEVRWATRQIARIKGPVYLRLGKRGEPAVYDAKLRFRIGKGVILMKGKQVAIVSCGNIVSETMKAAEFMKEKGQTPTLVSMTTVKPLDESLIVSLSKSHHTIISVEEHAVIGGLGSAIAESLTKNGSNARLHRLGIPDVFVHKAGSHEFVRKSVGIDWHSVARTALSYYD